MASPAFEPTATLLYPVVKALRAEFPRATLYVPVLYGADDVPPYPAWYPMVVL